MLRILAAATRLLVVGVCLNVSFQACAAGSAYDVVTTDTVPNDKDGNPPPSANTIATTGVGKHYVNDTGLASASSTSALAIFLDGTGSVPSEYRHFVDNAASQGFGAIGLAWVNQGFIGSTLNGCGVASISTVQNNAPPTQSDCYKQTRGEVAYGRNVSGVPGSYGNGPYNDSAYPTGTNSFNQSTPITIGDSIMNRLICLLDYLKWSGPSAYKAYYDQFLVDDTTSP